MRLSCLGAIALAAMMASARQLDFGPLGSNERLASPDGSKILYGVPHDKSRNAPPQLWIEDTRTHQRTKLFDILKRFVGRLVARRRRVLCERFSRKR